MSQEITTAFVQQYGANVMHLSQQKGSRIADKVRKETQKGKSQFFDRIGTVSAIKKAGRHSPTPQLDTPHSRRMVTLDDYEWADLVDDQDKIRLLIDPTSEYAMAAGFAFGRAKDDNIIENVLGNAYSGETGTTTVAHTNAQKYAANDGTNFTNLNVKSLRAAKRIMDQAEVDPSAKRYIAVTASQIESLLGQTEVTNADYNTVKALVQGEVNTFMGFEFVRMERLGTNSGSSGLSTTGAVGSGSSLTGKRSCIAWSEKGILQSIGEDVINKIDPRADLGYAMQVYSRMSIGSTRMEEVQVLELICTES
jgi:hypothetical protein